MLGYSLTIPETEKTTVLCEARLHTHKIFFQEDALKPVILVKQK